MSEFELTDNQAEAILNTRLRSLRKLEEIQLRDERETLIRERADIEDMIEDVSFNGSGSERKSRRPRSASAKNRRAGQGEPASRMPRPLRKSRRKSWSNGNRSPSSAQKWAGYAR